MLLNKWAGLISYHFIFFNTWIKLALGLSNLEVSNIPGSAWIFGGNTGDTVWSVLSSGFDEIHKRRSIHYLT